MDTDTASFFEFEESNMYSQRESELIQKYLQEHGEMLKTLEEWMEGKGYGSLSDFKGKMSQAKSSNPAAFERVQFMKYFGGKN